MSGTAEGVGRSAVGVLVATAASVAIGFVTQLVMARVLGPDGQGVVATLLTNALIVASLLGLGVPWALYYHSSFVREPRPELVGFSLVHAALLALVALSLAAVLGPELAGAQDVPGGRELYLVAALLVPATFLEYAYVDMLRGQRRFGLANRILLGSRILALVAVVVLVAVLDLGPRGALIALVAASAVQSLSALPVLLRRGVALSRRVARQVLGYGVRVQAASVSRLLARRFDILLLSLFVPSSAVGHYAVAQSIAELALLAPQALGLTLSPLITGGDADAPVTRRLIRVNGTVALAVCSGLAAVAPVLVGVAYGEAFDPALVPLLVLLPGVWMFACGEVVSHVLAARDRPGTSSSLSALQAGLTVALDLALVPPFGIVGAAIASSVAYTVYGVVSLVVVARADGVRPSALVLAGPAELHGFVRALTHR